MRWLGDVSYAGLGQAAGIINRIKKGTDKMKMIILKTIGLVAVLMAEVAARGQTLGLGFFGRNGELVGTNLQPGTVASVEWAPTVSGPWTNSWAGLAAVTADANGMIRVAVPMFYRIRGLAWTNFANPTNPPPPSGMVLIPAGSFQMGNAMDPSEGWYDELPLHPVEVSAFRMDQNLVTKALWDQVYAWAISHGYIFDHPGSGRGKAANHPVYGVSWYDTVKWCNARSEQEGRVPAYYTNAAQTAVYRAGSVDLHNDWVKWNAGYRLPTEAEWEKAARGGAKGHRFPWSNVDTITHAQANYSSATSVVTGKPIFPYDVSPTRGYHPAFNDGTFIYTSPAGYFAPNGYGLYDMAGNVREWCWDSYDRFYYGSSPTNDPRGPSSPTSRVNRGGSWYKVAAACRVAQRDATNPTMWYGIWGSTTSNLGWDVDLGFRTVLPAGQ